MRRFGKPARWPATQLTTGDYRVRRCEHDRRLGQCAAVRPTAAEACPKLAVTVGPDWHASTMADGIPEVLYHYTSMSNMLSILDSKMFWASDLAYSNDATETVYGRKEVLDGLAERAAEIRRTQAPAGYGDSGDPIRDYDVMHNPEFFAQILDTIVHREGGSSRSDDSVAYGVAFAKNGDQLSQWRGYAPGGCAIGFEREHLVAPYPEFQWWHEFVEVLYGLEAVEVVVDRICRQVAPEGRTSSSFDHLPNHDAECQALAHRALLSLKDPGFREEGEVRMVFAIPPRWGGDGYDPRPDKGRRGWRVGATGLLIPYLTVPFNLDAVREIWIGPGEHQERNVDATRRYLRNLPRSRPRIEVYPSTIPFI